MELSGTTKQISECRGIPEEQDYRRIAKRLKAGESVSRKIRISDMEEFTEHFQGIPVLVILGGGHISLPLSKLGKMLGYKVIVADDREEFADRERFKEADEVYCREFKEIFEQNIFPPYASYVIVTRGHLNDYECLRQVLDGTYTYVGMIGSRRKVATTFDKLRTEGYQEEQIQEVHAPIGIPIGGQTPEEIAVSIAAELIEERSRTLQTTMPPEILEWLENKKELLMMMTIVEKKGSAPRGVGSRMLIDRDGNHVGTVGGGAVEYRAQQQAEKLLESGTKIQMEEYDLSPKDAANLGMICGEISRLYMKE